MYERLSRLSNERIEDYEEIYMCSVCDVCTFGFAVFGCGAGLADVQEQWTENGDDAGALSGSAL